MKDYTHICIVLDASRSKEVIEDDIKGSFCSLIKTQKEIEQAAMVVKYMEQMGRYKNIREASSKGNGKLKASGLDYSWQSFCYDPEDRKDLWSVILAFGARGKIIKYRYTSPIRVLLQGDEKAIDELLKKEAFLPPMMTFILNMMDQELSKGQ